MLITNRKITLLALAVPFIASAEDYPRGSLTKPGWVLEINDDFSSLNSDIWLDHSNLDRGAGTVDSTQANYILNPGCCTGDADGVLRLQITGETEGEAAKPGLYRSASLDNDLRVSSIQTAQRPELHLSPENNNIVPVEPKYVPRYGYFEARIRSSASQFGGHHTAFWTVGWGEKDSQRAEFDIMENPGWTADPVYYVYDVYKKYYANIYGWDENWGLSDGKYSSIITAPNSLQTKWHTYGLEWTPDKVRFYLDDELKVTHDFSVKYPMAFLFSLYRGSNWTGNVAEGASSNFPERSMDIDFFRAYRRPSTYLMVDNDIHDVHGYRDNLLQNSSYWTNSGNSSNGVEGSSSRYTSTPGAQAMWTVNVFESNRYNVEAYIPNEENNTTSSTYEIMHSEGWSEVLIDQNSNAGKWVNLGEYHFDSNNLAQVTLTSNGGITRADAVRLVHKGRYYRNGFDNSGYGSGGLNGWNSLGGNWSINNAQGVLSEQSSELNSPSIIVTGSGLATAFNPDYFVSTDFTISQKSKNFPEIATASAGIIVRYSDEDNFYLLDADENNNRLRILKKLNGSFTTLASTSFDFGLDETYTLKFEANGNLLRAYINDELQVSSSDGSFPLGGMFGLRTFQAKVDFDNLFVGPTLTDPNDELYEALNGEFVKTIDDNKTGDVYDDKIRLQAKDITNSSSIIISGKDTLNDYSISSKVRVGTTQNGTAYGGLIGRHSEDGYYLLSLSVTGDKLRLLKFENERFHELDSISIALDEWQTLEMELKMVGNVISGHLNGARRVSATDSSFSSGKFGLRTLDATSVFENTNTRTVLN